MRRALLPALLAALVVAAPATAAPAPGAPPDDFAPARDALLRDGRVLSDLAAAGDAAGLHARFAPSLAAAVSLADVEGLLSQLRAAGPIGGRTGDSALPVAPERRIYLADHAYLRGGLALQFTLDAQGRATAALVTPRSPLPADPAAERRPVALDLPLRGTSWVWWGGREERTNYHVVAPAQRHAADLVVWRDGGTARGDGRRNAQYHVWGRTVTAPAAGTVVRVRDGVRDNRPQVEVQNREQPEGNHVVLRLASGERVLLAHLRRGSVEVRRGERVRAGTLLGRVGNSGNSSEPHLHLHVQTRGGAGVPFTVRRVLVDGRPRARAELLQGRFVRRR